MSGTITFELKSPADHAENCSVPAAAYIDRVVDTEFLRKEALVETLLPASAHEVCSPYNLPFITEISVVRPDHAYEATGWVAGYLGQVQKASKWEAHLSAYDCGIYGEGSQASVHGRVCTDAAPAAIVVELNAS